MTDTHSTAAAIHPGPLIRKALKDAGFSIPAAAVGIAMNRANLNNVILGKARLSHDLAYRLNVLIDPSDEAFNFARSMLERQAKYDWAGTASMRKMARVVVGAGRKYAQMVENGDTAHLTLTAGGMKQKALDEAALGKSPLG
jgi:plasmid maintenance system antidote protein VapI